MSSCAAMIRLAVVRSLVARHAPGPGHLHARFLGTHRRKINPEQLELPNQAREFVYSLSPANRSCLLKELQSFESKSEDSEESSPLTSAQLRYILLHNAIPFIGFGFLDNAIMIAAGTQIELSIGLTLGISTMAAAALGNLVSDLAGLGLAGYVEALATRFGMQIPDLTPKQVDMWQTRVTSHMGKAIGITIGCILGMFPLLFLSDDDDDKEEEKKKNDPNSK
ncbi:transmembrane protein 65 [Cyprinus carpio]|uniref:Transmembrane protein 65 n=2 Tax=Cyprinus carpio TaxID=7962 RepID=A0A8C1Z258_CYPCA|nr:transmembrane protein 65 [Cyprinus carpio]